MPPKRDVVERFWEKVVRGDRCWAWAAYRGPAGYGIITDRSRRVRTVQAHRLSWEIHNGPIPEGLCVLHRCDNPPCTNPAHLFLGTHADNAQDKASKGRNVNPLTDANKRRTQCPNGHPYDEANTLWRPQPSGRRFRVCLTCHNARNREWSKRNWARQKDARSA